ncbi:hypothetical protein [Fodinicola feengrottensis]|uniref:hypothetical protein n=1 Tax=Fodinicola feengrottensis TaxID=435914 RepID=UPI0013D1D3F9|nr:hypothetical protein [Fodinicola feengrottensis]
MPEGSTTAYEATTAEWKGAIEGEYERYAIAKSIIGPDGGRYSRLQYVVDRDGTIRERTSQEKAAYFAKFAKANPALAAGIITARARAAAWRAYCHDHPDAARAAARLAACSAPNDLLRYRATHEFHNYKECAKAYVLAHPTVDPNQWPQGWQNSSDTRAPSTIARHESKSVGP